MNELILRAASLEDSEAVFTWRNDPISRSFFIESSAIDRQEHEIWYRQSLESPDRHLFIGEVANHRVGVVRYDATGLSDSLKASINLDPNWRHRGYGQQFLEDSRPLLARNLDFKRLKLEAEIKPGNVASIKCFERAGYVNQKTTTSDGLLRLECSWPNFDAVICLSNAFDSYLKLNEESRERLDLAAQIFKAYEARKLVTLGWAYHAGTPVSLAQAMASYAQTHHQIAQQDIHIEARPKDTVGEAIYLATDCLPRYHWKYIAIVTGDWHLPRARHVFAHIFGSHCQISWFTIASADSYHRVEHSNRSQELFDAMVKNIPAGDVENLYSVIRKEHPLYRTT